MNNIKKPLILFDGVCNLCNGFIQFVIKRDRNRVFKFGSLQSEQAQKILSHHNLPDKYNKSIVLVKEEKVFLQSDAVLQIAKELKGWKWFYIFRFIPKFLRNAVYKLVSVNRYKIFGKRESCMVPSKELQDRFI